MKKLPLRVATELNLSEVAKMMHAKGRVPEGMASGICLGCFSIIPVTL